MDGNIFTAAFIERLASVYKYEGIQLVKKKAKITEEEAEKIYCKWRRQYMLPKYDLEEVKMQQKGKKYEQHKEFVKKMYYEENLSLDKVGQLIGLSGTHLGVLMEVWGYEKKQKGRRKGPYRR